MLEMVATHGARLAGPGGPSKIIRVQFPSHIYRGNKHLDASWVPVRGYRIAIAIGIGIIGAGCVWQLKGWSSSRVESRGVLYIYCNLRCTHI